MLPLVFLILGLISFLHVESSEHKPINNLIPLVDITLTPPPLGEFGSLSFSGEAGPKNFRGSATFGAYATPSQRIKVSGEFLTQRLRYRFNQEIFKEWIPKYAIGGLYQFILPNETRFMTLDLGLAYSHCGSQKIKTKRPHHRVFLYRKVVGSNDAFGFLGASSEVWEGGYLTVSANYDYIRFKKRFKHDWRKIGGGWSIYLTQCLLDNLQLTLGSDLRKPYKHFELSFDCNRTFTNWEIAWGLYGSYTHGKLGIPNAAAAGLQLSIAWGTCADGYSPYAWFKDLFPTKENYCNSTLDTSRWLEKPAVRLPIVLATEL